MSFLRRGARWCMAVGRVAARAAGFAIAGQPVWRGSPAPSRIIGRRRSGPGVRAGQRSRAACEVLGCCAKMRRCCMLVAAAEHSACCGSGFATVRRAWRPKRRSSCM